MCLSVYIGSNNPLTEPSDLCSGGLGLEAASWTPAPLKEYAHVYYLGARRGSGPLECTCLLAEYIDWEQDPPQTISDPLSDITDCPFVQLRRYVEAALVGQSHMEMVCDDAGGAEHPAPSEDYDSIVLTPSLIRAKSFLFADGVSTFAMRKFTVIHDSAPATE
jgi:hypothetical protein